MIYETLVRVCSESVHVTKILEKVPELCNHAARSCYTHGLAASIALPFSLSSPIPPQQFTTSDKAEAR